MARQKKPPELHVITGSFRQDRHGRKPSPDQNREPLGKAPPGWGPELKAIWHELANQVPAGVACKSDRASFEIMVRLFAKVRLCEPLTPAMAAQLRVYFNAFALTPSGRASLSAPPPPDGDDPLERFTDGRSE